MDSYQRHRREVFGPFASKEARGLEIGAGYRPTFPKSAGFNVAVIDHCNTSDLIAKHASNLLVPKELVAQIEEVDIVCVGGTYSAIPGLAESFDYVAACHVIEHAVDVCGFLKDCSALLKTGGYLLLAVPERSCIEDYYRPPSTLGDVLLAHVAPHAYDVKSRLDEVWYAAQLDGGLAWSRGHLEYAVNGGRVPLPVRDTEVAQDIWHLVSGEPLIERPYRDAHRWVFDQSSFEELARFLELSAGTGLHLVSMPGTFECEFYAILQKTPVPDRAREELQRSRLASFSCRHPCDISKPVA